MILQNKVAAIHDLSSVGRCALSVIIPTLSVMGIQVCAIPTAVLSAHTGGFGEVVMKDLTNFIAESNAHYQKLNFEFNSIYTGFLASQQQIEHCLHFFDSYPKALKIVDPVMGDNGKPYKTITPQLINGMKKLVRHADVITPNVTEAALLLGEEFPLEMTSQEAKSWLVRLSENADIVVITSVRLSGGGIANIGYDRVQNAFWKVKCDYVPVHYPGTGDIFSSVLTGGLLKGDSLPIAINRATTFTSIAVKTTYSYGTPTREGVMFERVLDWLNAHVSLSDYEKL